MTDLTGKIALITGASRGIGAATARTFAAAGAKVALVARSASELESLAQDIGPSARAFACDIADRAAFQKAIESAVQTLGPIDILVNNAGVIEPISRVIEADIDAWGKVIDVNLKAVFFAMRLIVPQMVERGGGTVLTVSSGAAHKPLEAWSAYCSSKAGAAMLTSALDLEERHRGIRTFGLSPGPVATQMQREIKVSGINPVSALEWSDHIPPEWPAKALLWMCGAEADPYIGQELSLRDETLRRAIGVAS